MFGVTSGRHKTCGSLRTTTSSASPDAMRSSDRGAGRRTTRRTSARALPSPACLQRLRAACEKRGDDPRATERRRRRRAPPRAPQAPVRSATTPRGARRRGLAGRQGRGVVAGRLEREAPAAGGAAGRRGARPRGVARAPLGGQPAHEIVAVVYRVGDSVVRFSVVVVDDDDRRFAFAIRRGARSGLFAPGCVRRRFAGQIDRGLRKNRSQSRSGRRRAVAAYARGMVFELMNVERARRQGRFAGHDESLDVGSSRKRDDHALRSLRRVRLAEAHGDRAGHRGLDSVVVAAHHARLVQRVVVHLGRRGGELGAPGGKPRVGTSRFERGARRRARPGDAEGSGKDWRRCARVTGADAEEPGGRRRAHPNAWARGGLAKRTI